MSSKRLTQRNVQIPKEEVPDLLKDNKPDHSDGQGLKSQQRTLEKPRFRPLLAKVFHSAYQPPNPWGPLVLRYLWYTLHITLLFTILVFPFLHTVRIVLEGEEHKEFLDYAFNSLEIAAPGSTMNLTLMIPFDWTPGSTQYDYYLQGMCRKEEAKKQVCERKNAERYLTGLIENIGAQIAEHMNDPSLSSEWSKTFQSALKAAVFNIKPGLLPAAVKFLTDINEEAASTGSTLFPVVFLVLSVLDTICDSKIVSHPAYEETFMVIRSCSFIFFFFSGLLYIIVESIRLDTIPIANFGGSNTRGPHFHLVSWCYGSKLVYYYVTVWYR